MNRKWFIRLGIVAVLLGWGANDTLGQQKSVRPGVNDSFRDPNVQEFVGRFEVESREVYSRRHEIVEACQLKPGQTVADIGAGTGLFTRMFAQAVGPEGRVLAVDIAQKFLDHVAATSREAGLKNVETVLASAESTNLPPESVDVAFISDTYHHFEFPLKTMASLHRALKPGGRVVLIDFRRVEGESTEWILSHVRAGQEVFEGEVVQSGFRKVREAKGLLRENYFVVFEKVAAPAKQFPLIKDFGGVVPVPQAVEQPRPGMKIVVDATAGSPSGEVNKGLERVARLVNLYGAAGLQASDLQVVVVLHGEATKAVLSDAAHRARFSGAANPNLPLLGQLRQAGVKVQVCGQALHYQGFSASEVAEGVQTAAAALTVIIHKQADGYSYVPVH